MFWSIEPFFLDSYLTFDLDIWSEAGKCSIMRTGNTCSSFTSIYPRIIKHTYAWANANESQSKWPKKGTNKINKMKNKNLIINCRHLNGSDWCIDGMGLGEPNISTYDLIKFNWHPKSATQKGGGGGVNKKERNGKGHLVKLIRSSLAEMNRNVCQRQTNKKNKRNRYNFVFRIPLKILQVKVVIFTLFLHPLANFIINSSMKKWKWKYRTIRFVDSKKKSHNNPNIIEKWWWNNRRQLNKCVHTE